MKTDATQERCSFSEMYQQSQHVIIGKLISALLSWIIKSVLLQRSNEIRNLILVQKEHKSKLTYI